MFQGQQTYATGSGAFSVAVADVNGDGKGDLVVANILAGPLTRLAPQIAGSLAPGGTLVLSGLLHNQEAMILSFYHRLRFIGRHRDGPWSALVLEKSGR